MTLARLEAALPAGALVIRVMPNTPALVGEAGGGICARQIRDGGGRRTGEEASLRRRHRVSGEGIVALRRDRLERQRTGLCLSIHKALSDGGVAAGLPRDIATKLAAQTVLGAAKMVLETGQHPGALKDQVTSPGGTTIEGLHELEKGKLRATVMSAVRAATEKSKKLGQG